MQGDSQNFAVNVRIVVFIDNIPIGEIGKGEVVEIPIEQDCCVEFRCGYRKSQFYAKRGYQQALSVK